MDKLIHDLAKLDRMFAREAEQFHRSSVKSAVSAGIDPVRPAPFPRTPAAVPTERETMSMSRLGVKAAIRQGAMEGRQVRVEYVKRSGSTVIRYVSPYSYRRHLFFGKDGHTKSFVFDNIQEAKVTQRPANPNYPVEIR